MVELIEALLRNLVRAVAEIGDVLLNDTDRCVDEHDVLKHLLVNYGDEEGILKACLVLQHDYISQCIVDFLVVQRLIQFTYAIIIGASTWLFLFNYEVTVLESTKVLSCLDVLDFHAAEVLQTVVIVYCS